MHVMKKGLSYCVSSRRIVTRLHSLQLRDTLEGIVLVFFVYGSILFEPDLLLYEPRSDVTSS